VGIRKSREKIQYWGPESQCGKIEREMKINTNGESEWYSIESLEKKLKFKITGNGSPLFNKNRGIGLKYEIVKKRGAGRKILEVKTTGFTKLIGYATISSKTRKKIKDQECACCGTSCVEPDHRDPRLDYIGELPIEHFQPLCPHCNDVKREK